MDCCKKNKKLFFLLLFGFLLIAPTSAINAEGVIPCGNGITDPCTICHFIVGFKNLIDWGRNILIALSITSLSIAGVMYVVSSGDPEMTKKAKNLAVNTVIGFSLMLGAWLIINTTFWLFSAKTTTGDSTGKYSLGLEAKSWDTFTCSTASSSTAPTGEESVTPPISDLTDFCNTITFQNDAIRNQCFNGDASPELMGLISCMYNQFDFLFGYDSKAMMINSISDSNGGVNCYATYTKQCTPPTITTNCCFHAKNSCHYGGTCAGQSFAIDINTSGGSVATANQIQVAATQCGAKSLVEGTHIHASIARSGCNCDQNL